MKKLLATKTFWAGFTGVATGVAMALQGQTTEGIAIALSGLQTIFLRQGIQRSK
jgi:hypothetical protein